MLLDQLSCSIDALPTCVKYAAVFPLNCRLTDGEIRAIQTFLVAVWQHHIKQWHAGTDLVAPVQGDDHGQVIRSDNLEENGHLLSARASGPGIWCMRCGKFTSMLKRVRLKITRLPCTNPHGPVLQQEGHNMAESRLDRLEHELNEQYNTGGHVLQWNRKIGKQSVLMMRGGCCDCVVTAGGGRRI